MARYSDRLPLTVISTRAWMCRDRVVHATLDGRRSHTRVDAKS